MKRVNFIRQLVVEVRAYPENQKEIDYAQRSASSGILCPMGDEVIQAGQQYCRPDQRINVPIVDIRRLGSNSEPYSTFIAYSPEVEELIQMPFKLTVERCERAELMLADARKMVSGQAGIMKSQHQKLVSVIHAGFWDRLKFLFTGNSEPMMGAKAL